MNIINDNDEFMDEWCCNRKRITNLVLILAKLRQKSGRGNYVDRLIRTNEEISQRERTRNELMNKIRTDKSSYDVIRMTPQAFAKLCNMLRASGHVSDIQKATLEEQVAKFLHILGHNVKNRSVSFFFNRSSETTSRHFHRILKAILLLEDRFLIQANGADVPPEILNNSRFFPYFKDCIGALDGTHIRVKASIANAARYRGRKEHPTTNVLAVGSFDLKFAYVLAGWEGTASDSRIIKDAFTREDNLKIPFGKYCLVDGGYMLTTSLLAPYRGVRYHLKEYSKRAPENARELFNHRHSSLRIAIERAFGVLKIRFPIIGDTKSTYSIETQTEICLACCILHNFLMGVDPYQELLDAADQQIQHQNPSMREVQDNNDEDTRRAVIMRDNIATAMWNDYVL